MTTLLRPIDIDGLRRAEAVPALADEPAITLAAAVELACTIASGGTERAALAEAAASWFGRLTLWRAMIAWLVEGKRPPRPADAMSAPVSEMWAIEGEDDVAGTNWVLFQDRFRRTATRHGFSSSLGAALSRALAEMADNVYQHSGGARGLAVFHFADKRVSWCVGDVGQGVLGSLRSSERWSHLQSARDALVAVWHDGATRRPGARAGDGFRQVERSLAALSGRLRFRTDNAVLELEGMSGALRPTSRTTPVLAGLQIAATCALGDPGEIVVIS
jgi:hypothetical protein